MRPHPELSGSAGSGLAAIPVMPTMRFDEASQAVVDYLQSAIPLGCWSVTRYDGERQLALSVADRTYGLEPGDSWPWSHSMCQYMVTGATPQIAPDVNKVPQYRDAPVRETVPIGAYVGVPIQRTNGELFGTLCGLDPATHGDDLREHQALLQLFTNLLATILEADQERTATMRALEHAELKADTDALTELLNRRGWDRYLALEEDRYRRFGDPGSVVVIDLDRLKFVNDTYGHEAGDEHLRRAARVLRDTVRPGDVVARLGGDEFGVLVGGVTPEQMAALAVRLQEALQAAGVAGSIGHAPYTVVAGFPGAWRNADDAMYAQKAVRREMT